MSDRRFLVVLIALLSALIGVAMLLVPLLVLPDPFVASGEIGERVDVTRLLIASMVLGAVMIAAGGTVIVWIVRHQVRSGAPSNGAHHDPGRRVRDKGA